MQVRALQLFLRSLRSAVDAADGNSSLPADLEAVSTGLEHFAGLDCGQFAAFLRQAEQYRASGAVSVPSPTGLRAEKVQMGLRSASSVAETLSNAVGFDAQQVMAERDRARQELEEALGVFLKPLGIGVTLKDDRRAFESTLKSARVPALANQVQAVLAGATDAASLKAPERQEKLRVIVDQLQLADLKAVATQLGASASGRTKESVLSAIEVQVTGVNPAGKKPPPATNQAAVQQQAVKLKGLLEQSLDPEGLSETDVDAAINELKTMKEAELQAVAQEAGLDNVGKKKAGILKRIRERLTEARRVLEGSQV